MASRNPSEPFDEIATPSGAAAARMVEDTGAVPVPPPVPVIEHTHAADRLLAPPARTSDMGRSLGQWIGEASRRFESARQYIRSKDANSIKTDALVFARRYPVQTLAGSLLAGLVVGRLLRRK